MGKESNNGACGTEKAQSWELANGRFLERKRMNNRRPCAMRLFADLGSAATGIAEHASFHNRQKIMLNWSKKYKYRFDFVFRC